MQISQGPQHLGQQLELYRLRLTAPRVQNRLRAFQKLHREKWLTLLIEAVIQHADDMWMAQRRQCAKLVRQRNLIVLSGAERREEKMLGGDRQALESNVLSGEAVSRSEHLTHSARAQ